ncbi:ATP-binding protein [Virgibacillus salinus]|uniref:histidine kinase n=1 Tax=Virgibacillus salinus TaxID=553311 RepID=A0A1H0Z8V7_9BACI|nr:sensor histidine kinase [Virgibacillus salinus]SDQ23862.1 two-component system, CitB family, sensor histidine kinase CitS [Virgibacillus salinus]
MKRVSLQTKILGLIIMLILFVTILLAGIISYIESEETSKNIGEKALHVATTVSFMPSVKNAFKLENPAEVIQPIAERIRKKVGAEFIVIGNSNSIRYAHPDDYKLGRRMVGGDNGKALIHGQYYTSRAVGSLGPSLRGKAPIFNDQGKIIGIVSVGYMVEDIKSIVYDKLLKITSISLLVLVIGVIGGILLARNIRKDTHGLEPHEIASLYRDRNAILQSIKEGIIAIDKAGYISMMNPSARKILGLSGDDSYRKIEEIIPNTKMYNVLKSKEQKKDEEMFIGDREIIVNRTPIFENNEVVGVVASFRDKTEINEMLNALSEVRRYSEDLRAHTHEYTNKLYVLSGLLQLGHYNEAIELIQSESAVHLQQNNVVLQQIKDKAVQAILLGKISKASEKKIDFHIDSNSSLEHIPRRIDISKLITILGNLIDNAFEAVVDSEYKKQVTFFATDIGEDIIFDISDNGCGVKEEHLDYIFDIGFSTKEKIDRGYGLSSVKEIIDELNGVIEVHNQQNGGVVFSVFIPKKQIGSD